MFPGLLNKIVFYRVITFKIQYDERVIVNNQPINWDHVSYTYINLTFTLRKDSEYIEKEDTANIGPGTIWGFDLKAIPASHFYSDTRSNDPSIN